GIEGGELDRLKSRLEELQRLHVAEEKAKADAIKERRIAENAREQAEQSAERMRQERDEARGLTAEFRSKADSAIVFEQKAREADNALFESRIESRKIASERDELFEKARVLREQ